MFLGLYCTRSNFDLISRMLVLIPTPLFAGTPVSYSAADLAVIQSLTHFAIESHKEGRNALRGIGLDIRDKEFALINEHTTPEELDHVVGWLKQGKSVGLLSDAGCPGIADPGAPLVLKAHELGVKVKPLVGPSSVLLAVMASGMPSQRFAFKHYLPVNRDARKKAILELEAQSAKESAIMAFIETPYRNEHLFADLIKITRGETLIGIAVDLTSPDQLTKTLQAVKWRTEPAPDLRNRPCVFTLYAKGKETAPPATKEAKQTNAKAKRPSTKPRLKGA